MSTLSQVWPVSVTHRDRHQYAQPQQPRRYPHRQGRDPGKCRQGSRHGGRGHDALPAALELAERYQVEMPIVQTVNAIVNKGMSAAEAVKSLMERGLKNELPQGYEK